MSGSVTFASAEAFQDYIRDFHPTLISKLYHRFPSRALFTPIEMVKDEYILTELTIGSLAKKWDKDFSASTDKINFKPRKLTVTPYKIDLKIYPQEFEGSYLGRFRTPGFQPDDIPFYGYILDRIFATHQEELEVAVFQALINSPTTNSPLIDCFNGLLKIVADELTAASITAVTTPAHTNENAIENAELVHSQLSPAHQAGQTVMLCSYAFSRLLAQNLREQKRGFEVKKYDGYSAIPLDIGNVEVVPCVGMGTSSRLICTPKDNLFLGYDAMSDENTIRVEKDHRALDLMIDAKIGTQFGIVNDAILRVNNLT